jgi:hypothetical protein
MIKSVKIGTLELSAENGYYLSAIKDLGYKTKYPSATVLHYHGVKLGDAYFQNRALAFELKVVGFSQNDLIEKRSNLYKYLTIKENNSDLIDIEITLANNLKVMTSGVIKEVASDIDSEGIIATDISFILEVENPFFKSSQVYEVNIPITKGGGGNIPMAIPFDMSHGTSGFKVVSTLGNIFCYPTIYFYGILTNPVLTNLTNNQSINYSGTISSGGWVKVETYDRTVADNVGNNVRDKIGGNFLILEVGDNQFKLLTDNPTEAGYVKLIYQYYYISI